MSIHDNPTKINAGLRGFIDSQKGHDFMVILTILGVAIASFSLGLKSAQKDDSRVVIRTDPSLIVASTTDYTDKTTSTLNKTGRNTESILSVSKNNKPDGGATNSPGLPFVASKKGKKYYPVNCPAAKNLAVTNRIYFKDGADAEAKGYTLSTSCQLLNQ
ncbi:MAG: hypothetical protein RL641_196 [Candidatus Parcubacteria bacterium]|jgi:hypothetical protein